MTERQKMLMVLSQRSDERLRTAFAELDALATARGTAVSHEVVSVCTNVIVDTAARTVSGARHALRRRAWVALGVAVGVGLLLERVTRQ